MTDKVVTEVEPAAKSAINWVQAAGIISSIAAFLGFSGLDPVQVSQVILGIQAAQSIITVILKTYYDKHVTPQAAAGLPGA
jgi:hypothetical protein